MASSPPYRESRNFSEARHRSSRLGSVALAVLFCLDYLPGYERAPFLKTGHETYEFSAWCVGGGMLMTVVTFIVWRSKSRIFVDILCMEQHNPKLKAGTPKAS
eukprot:g31146.t1